MIALWASFDLDVPWSLGYLLLVHGSCLNGGDHVHILSRMNGEK